VEQEKLIREIQAVGEPVRLQELLASHCDQFALEVVKALKERVDDLNRASPCQALALAEAGLSAAEACSDAIARAWMLWARAHAQMQLEDYRSGLASCDAALEILRDADHLHTAAQVQTSRLFALVNLGQEEEAIQLADGIRSILEQHGDQYALARLDTNLGIAYDDTDRHEQALAHFEAAGARFEALQEPLEVLRARINTAVALENLDRYDEAIAIYSEVRPDLVALDKPMVLARHDFDMAVLHFWLGEYARALEGFEAARRAFSKLDVPAEMDQVDLYKAMLYLELNLFDEVVETCSAVERQASEHGIVRDVVLAKRLGAVARGYRRWPGDWKGAVSLLEDARALATSREAHLQAAQIDLDIALLLLERGLPNQALSLARRSAGRFSQSELRVRQTRARILCGRCLLSLGRSEEAERQFLAALAVAEELSLIQLASHCHHGLGQIAEAHCDRGRARQHYDLAIESIERLRERILVDDFRASFLEGRLQVYADAARLCLEGGDTDAAFGYVERGKARVLLDLISASTPSAPRSEPEAATGIRQRLHDLERRWNALQRRQLPDPRKAQDHERLTNVDTIPPQVRHELTGLEQQMVALRRELQVLSPTLAGLVGERVLGLADVQRQLGDEITLLEYFVHDKRLVVLIVDKEHCRFQTLEAQPDEVTRVVRELLTDLQAYQSKWDVPIARQLRSLYEYLLEPVRSLIDTQRLVLIPHGSLYHVPFPALHDGDRFVVETLECTYAPSATVHALCEGRTSGGTGDVIIAFSGEGRIPNTIEEATQVSAVLPDALVLCEDAATMEAFGRFGSKARILHLATHGCFRGDNPLFSTMQLADADLTVRQVYELQLEASLVTLSACETGLSHLQGSDLVGLAEAFLYAGAASLVVSLWHTQDESTARLMQAFYRGLTQGQRKAATLRAAQMELLNSGEFCAPFYWAPFVLYGDAGRL
jgi:CHAT domain-containing protein